MIRRTFLSGCLLSSAAAYLRGSSRQVRVLVNTRKVLGSIPRDFIGLGYEISSVAVPGLLSATNKHYVQLVRTLGNSGVIRVGGNTSDDASFEADGRSIAAPKGTVVNADNLQQLGSFLNATGWKLIWGLNLGSGSVDQAVLEARAVVAAVGENLHAFEIGNEPDLFRKSHRPADYSYDEYLKDYRRYKAAIRTHLPHIPFAGPDAAGATDWVSRFAADEGRDLRLLTHHYYRECANPGSTLEKLLYPDPKLAPELAKLENASLQSHEPYRICETNSFCGGGKPGVSDTFGAALWVLDFMFKLAYANCARVNIETGVNQLGFISSYSPIGDDGHGTNMAMPDYYGMLAFAQASEGKCLALQCDAAGANLTAYAVMNNREFCVTLINKDRSSDADVQVSIDAPARASGKILRLAAPSLESRDGVTLGGSSLSEAGSWSPKVLEPIQAKSGVYELRVPAASAAILKLSRPMAS